MFRWCSAIIAIIVFNVTLITLYSCLFIVNREGIRFWNTLMFICENLLLEFFLEMFGLEEKLMGVDLFFPQINRLFRVQLLVDLFFSSNV